MEAQNLKKSQSWILTFVLALPIFTITLSNLILNLLSLEIASTFQIHEGIAVQLRTINGVAEVTFGFIIGLISTRFKPKLLLLVGTSLMLISSIGSTIANSFELLLFFFFLEGTASVIIAITIYTLAGNLFSLKRKNKAISWISSAGFFAVFVATFAVAYIVSFGSWRYTFLLIVLPFSVIALIF